jgi:hypothetical protein
MIVFCTIYYVLYIFHAPSIDGILKFKRLHSICPDVDKNLKIKSMRLNEFCSENHCLISIVKPTLNLTPILSNSVIDNPLVVRKSTTTLVGFTTSRTSISNNGGLIISTPPILKIATTLGLTSGKKKFLKKKLILKIIF